MAPGIWEQCPPVEVSLLPQDTLLAGTAVPALSGDTPCSPMAQPQRAVHCHPICRHPPSGQTGPLSSAAHPRPICSIRPLGTSFIFLAQGFWALRKPSSASLVSLKPPMICL